MTGRPDGFGVVEAIVALALAAIAFGALATSAHVGTLALRRSSARQATASAATERLEALRAGPRHSGDDLVTGPPAITRVWTRTPGRGRPDALAVEAECDGSHLALRSAVWP